MGVIADHPADRCSDLYFLNTMEHLAVACSPKYNEDVVMPAVTPYLTGTKKPEVRPPFEAAHSVMLSIISTPSAASFCAKFVPFYVEAVFQVCFFY